MNNYWIEYTNGTRKLFEAEDDKAAHYYFMMEGDHAYDWGPVDKAHFKKCLEGPKTWGDILYTPMRTDGIVIQQRVGRQGRAKYEIDTDDDE